MVPSLIGGRKVGVGEVPEGYKPIHKEGNKTYYEKVTLSPPNKRKITSSDIKSKTQSASKTTPSRGGRDVSAKSKTTPGKRERDLIYTETETAIPPTAAPTPIKAFIGEHIFGPNKHALGATINVSRDSNDAATESGLVDPMSQEDIFVKYIPGTAKPDLNNVYKMPKGVFSRITGGTIAVQSQDGMDLLEKYKVDPKTIEKFKNRIAWTSHL